MNWTHGKKTISLSWNIFSQVLVGDDIEGNEDDDGEETWGSVGEDVAEDVGDEEVGDVENSEEDGDEVRQTIDSILQIFETGSLI